MQHPKTDKEILTYLQNRLHTMLEVQILFKKAKKRLTIEQK